MPEWELNHKADIKPSFLQHYTREDRENIEKPWSLDRGKKRPKNQVACGWDSSDDSGLDREGEDGVYNEYGHYDMSYCMDLLGYHPSKEIAFLGDHFEGFAYYLGSSKLQYLGTFEPVGCCHRMVAETHESFIYTPCMDDLLPYHKNNTTHDDLEEEEDEDLEEEDDEDTDEDEDPEEEEEEDTDEDEDQVDEDEDADEDKDLEKKDEDFKGSEESSDEDEDWSFLEKLRLS
ncbi:unnamed protein product [Urochloa humidicola]